MVKGLVTENNGKTKIIRFQVSRIYLSCSQLFVNLFKIIKFWISQDKLFMIYNSKYVLTYEIDLYTVLETTQLVENRGTKKQQHNSRIVHGITFT